MSGNASEDAHKTAYVHVDEDNPASVGPVVAVVPSRVEAPLVTNVSLDRDILLVAGAKLVADFPLDADEPIEGIVSVGRNDAMRNDVPLRVVELPLVARDVDILTHEVASGKTGTGENVNVADLVREYSLLHCE